MNGSTKGTTRNTTQHHQPATPEEFLDHQEAMAIQRIADSVRRMGDDVCIAVDLRQRIRRYPFLATGLGAFLGFVGGPLFPRAFWKMLTATPSIAKFAFWRPRAALPVLVLASMRVLRTRRTRDR